MLLKELIEIPDRVYQGDFVLKLTEGVNNAAAMLENYVVTPDLAEQFDKALGLVQSAVQENKSKATYLHGSFGSGKSHFMAVLHQILMGDNHARSIPELAGVIQKHNPWLAGKKFLLVPYHLIGANTIESGILGQYAQHIRTLHPEAPIPPVSSLEYLLISAREERKAYGDDAFFRRLNSSRKQSGDDGWGDTQTVYDPVSFENAADSPIGSPQHQELTSCLLETVARGQATGMAEGQGAFVKLDIGLRVISEHARALGYNAVILFLDELILWLASRSADHAFVHEQASKLTNLVEGQDSNRPIPLISFVARQRDLRELVGEHVPGAQQLSFSQSLDWQQGRFTTIMLEDRNLPAIAQKRVLRPRNAGAVAQLDAAFENAQSQFRHGERDTLLTKDFDLAAFRKVYPFSPALIEALVAVSGLLQRERTALKIMMQLLVNQRETLELGQIIPLGDLYDLVNTGEEAFAPAMARHFANARTLYDRKMLPLLEQSHNLKQADALKLPSTDPKRKNFIAEDRLMKTLLLSSLVPEVEVLRDLTAERLVALNFGSIRVPIRGNEAATVLTKVRDWAARVGEIRLSDTGPNPRITVRISGVDTQAILDQVQAEDNHGNRLRLVRDMLKELLQLGRESDYEADLPFLFRNTSRKAHLSFRNVRELPAVSFENEDSDWKVIIDFPFDEPNFTPDDDQKNLRQFRQSHPKGARTLCWMPSFLSGQALEDMGMLVRLRRIFSSEERFQQYSGSLSPQDRGMAREQLINQKVALEERVKNYLLSAYGVSKPLAGALDEQNSLEGNDHFQSLWAGLQLREPTAAGFDSALFDLLNQALLHDFPAAPEFGIPVKTNDLKRVRDLIKPATQKNDGRVPIDRTMRELVRHLANPLLIGQMNTDHNVFVLVDHWKKVFEREIVSGLAPSVKELRTWIDKPKRMGLDSVAQNLIILMFAEQTNRAIMRNGAAYDADPLTNLPDDCVLQSFVLPTETEWQQALVRAGAIFGITQDRDSNALTVRTVTALQNALHSKADKVMPYCARYTKGLMDCLRISEGTHQNPPRLQTAQATLELVRALTAAIPEDRLRVLNNARIATSETAMGSCVSGSEKWAPLVENLNWDLFGAISKFSDHRKEKAQLVVLEIIKVFESDEHVRGLESGFKSQQAAAMNLLTEVPPQPDEPPRPIPPIVVPPLPVEVIKDKDKEKEREKKGRLENISSTDVPKFIGELEKKLPATGKLKLTIDWEIVEGGA